MIASRGETDTIANAKLYQADSGNTKDGVNMTCFARKTGIDAGTTDIKHVSKMYPKVRGGPVKFRTGSAMSQLDNYTWGEYQEYNPQSGDWKLDIRTTGRFLGFEIYSDEDVDWGLDSITFESQISGQR